MEKYGPEKLRIRTLLRSILSLKLIVIVALFVLVAVNRKKSLNLSHDI